jgi:hypothetical protein
MTRPACPELRTSVTEYGVHFETGVPVTFSFVRGTTPSPKPRPGQHDAYQQRLEPAGRYMVHNPDPGRLPPGWEQGTVHFRNPLVVPLSRDPETIYGASSWKVELSRAFGGKRGSALSRALVRAGYDGVVTVTLDRQCRGVDTREIVDLKSFTFLGGPGPSGSERRG